MQVDDSTIHIYHALNLGKALDVEFKPKNLEYFAKAVKKAQTDDRPESNLYQSSKLKQCLHALGYTDV